MEWLVPLIDFFSLLLENATVDLISVYNINLGKYVIDAVVVFDCYRF